MPKGILVAHPMAVPFGSREQESEGINSLKRTASLTFLPQIVLGSEEKWVDAFKAIPAVSTDPAKFACSER
ncbi:hypothetical protein HYW32_00570 [Candidatus Berkelbacteria bacterium]|nr:hypothetical protein [Candidatus Berkelbacteria bacterium]